MSCKRNVHTRIALETYVEVVLGQGVIIFYWCSV